MINKQKTGNYASYLSVAVWFFCFLFVLLYKTNQQPVSPHFVKTNPTFIKTSSAPITTPIATPSSTNTLKPNPANATTTQSSPSLQPSPAFEQHIISQPHPAPSVHAASLSTLNNNELLAVWFAGAREGASDVAIVANRYSLTKHRWATPYPILTREQLSLQSHQYIKKLGNPVIYQSQDGMLHLFVVGVSFGGWAGSKLYHLQSTNGINFDFVQLLPLSPLMNISHLVRNRPIGLDDGGFYLPIYHEFAQKFPLLLRFDHQGKLIDRIRPNPLLGVLQPAITATNSSDCLMVARNEQPAPIWQQHCSDGGTRWHKPTQLPLINDNSALSIDYFNHHLLLVHNQSHQGNSRYHLVLSSLGDKTIHSLILDSTGTTLANNLANNNAATNAIDSNAIDSNAIDTPKAGEEVSYPTTLVVGDNLHIVYTHDRNQIRHIRINQDWLKQAMPDPFISPTAYQ